jgi:hypothetical protein
VFSSEVGIGSRQETRQTKGGKSGLDSSRLERLKKLRERAFFLFLPCGVSWFRCSAGGDGAKVEADTIRLFWLTARQQYV